MGECGETSMCEVSLANSFGLEMLTKVLYIGLYLEVRIYIWSLIDEIQCIRCSTLCR